MDKLSVSARKIEGKLQIVNRPTLDYWISQLDDNQEVEITLVKDKNLKTLKQLKLLYHCFREISSHTGYEVEEVKLMMKMKAGYCQAHNIEGVEIISCTSISDMTKKEIRDFIEWIDNWAGRTLSLPLLNNEDKQFLNSI